MQGGTISVEVTDSGVTHNLSLAVVVNPRAWDENDPPVPLGRTGNGRLAEPPRRNPDLGETGRVPTINSVAGNVASGPNRGFNWLQQEPVTWVPRAFSNDALYDATHPFNRAHGRALLPAGRAPIAALREDVESHEGIIAPPVAVATSHWQMARDHLAVAANQINIPREADVTHNTNETAASYQFRVSFAVFQGVIGVYGASVPHPPSLLPPPGMAGTHYNYPYITPRTLTLTAGGAAGPLAASNLLGPANVRGWASDNLAVATVNAAGLVAPVAAGTANITVTDTDGDVDQISVTVNP